ncbi:4,5-dihydroxyphthalate dehydrogenase [Tistlia consotensis]|uniref:4,5-dihydroxyphthalate dehydrogenase n=1 Tax=Tistlia consotensis USBA 355 TaxID=560819 RepID=A0A1Y6CUE6_9PROT|nr:Gfo/Idh/MocA family oxidoreductase [Tistlia consotensis]SMF75512.1 4,5-dihydroxyphthalate dehydrogenase [Tistlia consotensis USBA 355]SNS07911.1 4,5-dihydroxyphthalate dehydrogenase [Tistlia consotensis]
MSGGREAGRQVRLGICGLGRAFMLMLPTFRRDARFRLVAAATPGEAGRARFVRDFGGRAYATMAELCADPEVEAIYVASPHQFHAEQVAQAAAAGKHLLVEKPLAVSLEDGKAMVAAAETAGIHLIVGPSHSFDRPVLEARALIDSGAVGRVRMIQALNYTDFLYRPRRPEELVTAEGGGVVFSQAVHQIDVVRLLGGGLVRSVRAMTGDWDPERPTEGAYALLLDFEDGAFASLTYSGYARFDSDELMGWFGELGSRKSPAGYGRARRALRGLASAAEEAALKRTRTYGGSGGGGAGDREPPLPAAHEHFGFLLASCEKADLRPLPDRLLVYGDEAIEERPIPAPEVPRREVMDELWAAVVEDRAPLHSGAWGLASLEVCHGILRSAAERREIMMTLQVPYRGE